MEQIFSFCPTDRPLSAVHRSWGFPNDEELSWFFNQGVSPDVLWPISGATVLFDGPRFSLDEEGERALTFCALDRGKEIDLINRRHRFLARARLLPGRLRRHLQSLHLLCRRGSSDPCDAPRLAIGRP
jgi:hypothetical protein